ncbi:hypothetical protein LSCM1_06890 [Leishmania martiniquensis]|uniref:Axonemal dynein intermediate chain protein n=1 Tax=Leishmania martiniquensis TaxID=1580590 RepID=A0A836KYS1_9TRYP|nr:hypothetical protein LSCM1_06890 [Leishmania martiniquensis]
MTTNASAVEYMAKTRQSVLDVGQRNQLEAMQAEVRRNNEQLTSLRRENKELRLVLQQTIRGQRNISVEDHYAKEEDMLHNKMCVLKRSLNAVKGKNAELLKEIERTIEENRFIQQEGNGVLQEDSAVAQTIRALENRLDKCLVKHNEVQTIRRTYETLLERLQLEQAGFNTQISSTEQALQCANKELGELVAVWKSAAKARDTAKAEVSDLKMQLAAERQRQRKDLDERRAFIESKRQQLERKHESMLLKLSQQEDRHARTLQNAAAAAGGSARRRGHRSLASSASSLSPEDLEQVQRQKTAYLRLRDVTTGANVTDVLAKLRERSAQHLQLQATAAELEASMQQLEKERLALQSEWEEVNHRAGHALVSARVMRAARDQDGGAENESGHAGGAHSNGSDGNSSRNASAEVSGAGTTDYGLLADRRHERRLVLEEFRQHLRQRQDELEEAEEQHNRLAQLLREVDLGVQYLAEKLSISGALPVTACVAADVSAAPQQHHKQRPAMQTTLTIDLLRNCGAKLQLMLEELPPGALSAVVQSMSRAKFLTPCTNVRVPEVLEAQRAQQQHTSSASNAHGPLPHIGSASPSHAPVVSPGGGPSSSAWRAGSADSDAPATGAAASGAAASVAAAMSSAEDFPENEIHDRQELKMMSMATVEREQQKARKRQMQQRRNKDETA